MMLREILSFNGFYAISFQMGEEFGIVLLEAQASGIPMFYF